MLDTAEKLNFDDVKVICDPEKNNIHSVYCTLILDQSLQEKFSKTEILEFNLGGIQVPVKFKEENENLKKMFIFCDTKK